MYDSENETLKRSFFSFSYFFHSILFYGIKYNMHTMETFNLNKKTVTRHGVL